MKRKPLILAFALIFVISAALWGVNYRLNNPPLSDEDKQFRALVGTADRVGIYQWSCIMGGCANNSLVQIQMLNPTQTGELLDNLRFVDLVPYMTATETVFLELHFWRRGKTLGALTIYQDKSSTWVKPRAPSSRFYKLHPVYEKRLRRYLNEIAPKRIQP